VRRLTPEEHGKEAGFTYRLAYTCTNTTWSLKQNLHTLFTFSVLVVEGKPSELFGMDLKEAETII